MSETPRVRLNQSAIKALALIILTAVGGIIVLSFWGLTLRYGLFNAESSETGGVADEALSILGNIAAASVGGLVGWLTRDYIENKATGYQELPPGSSVTPPVDAVEGAPDPSLTETVKDENAITEDEAVPEAETALQPEVEEQEDAIDAPTHPDELDEPEDPELTWEDEPKAEESK